MKHQPTVILLCAILLLGLSGCATRHQVRLDALSTGDLPASGSGLSYVLVSGTPEVEENDLFFKEVKRHVDLVLNELGYRAAGTADAAEIQISVDAHLSEPLVESQNYSEPIYVETGGYHRAYRVPILNDEGKVVRYRYYDYWEPRRLSYTGWVHRDRQVTVYDKVLALSARRILAEGKLSDEVWAITIALRNESTDYRAALPYLLVAARPYIGRQTQAEQVITLREDDPELQAYIEGLGYAR